MGNNIKCSIKFKYGIVSKLYTLETWFFRYIIVNTLHTIDKKYNSNNTAWLDAVKTDTLVGYCAEVWVDIQVVGGYKNFLLLYYVMSEFKCCSSK
jgi:hypothetical protein